MNKQELTRIINNYIKSLQDQINNAKFILGDIDNFLLEANNVEPELPIDLLNEQDYNILGRAITSYSNNGDLNEAFGFTKIKSI